ncbi:MAG: DNA mismatch repair endonuclease MutL [Lachnospiraceae bacterium]|nr:DNA mismatch repair endonuclease MutL [Lachnospiraceae bacterium]
MPDIRVLDEKTIEMIAAGEVIENPASIVKELVENSIDAGAKHIRVEVSGGGIDFLRVTDDGCGIKPDQVRTAFLRHATSKIRNASDLSAVTTMGFRGEALASVAAVARVEMITKTSDEELGRRILIEGSKEKAFETVGAPDGTDIVIRDVFFNTPARRKFLKSASTEGSHVSTVIEHLSLCNPGVSFDLTVNGRPKLHTSGNGNSKDVIYKIYGREISNNLIEVNRSTDRLHVSGFLGKPVITRGNRTLENYFINSRYIKSNIINKAIEDGMRPFMMLHQYPFCSLSITVDEMEVDVNVHPQKMEIKFSESNCIYNEMLKVVREAVTGEDLVPREADTGIKERTGSAAAQKPVVIDKTIIPAAAKSNTVVEELPWNTPGVSEPDKEVSEESSSTNNKAVTAADIPSTDSCEEKKHAFLNKRLEEIRESIKKDTPYKTVYPERRQANEGEVAKDRNVSVSGHEKQVAEQEFIIESGEHADGQDTEKKYDKPSAGQYDAYSGALDRKKTVYVEPSPEIRQITLMDVASEDPEKHADFIQKVREESFTLIGQLFETYWLAESEDQLFVIDQHAAHEKILFERNLKRFKENDFYSQQISPPVIITLDSAEEQVLNDNMELFEKMGFEIGSFGGNDFAISAVPDMIYTVDRIAFFKEILELLEEDREVSTELMWHRIATASCKAAVKGNTRLTFEEAKKLISELLTLENPYHCPHGRPVIFTMTKADIEKRFKRIV